ncbi:MAG: nucleotidyl transferase AbiEii/AbiGii toxin family protein, partial [Myxococcota bacterium]
MSRETLLLWVMHRFARAFEDHAILKGGMALRLWSSPRATNDIDYVLVPFESKSEVAAQIRAVLTELPGADVQVTLHSTMVRAEVRMDGAAIQIEASVASECPSEPMATGDFARALGAPSQIVRVMTPSVALAHKLAAWNERRLLRDLYDSYFLSARVGASPDRDTLTARLQHVRSRLPQLRRVRAMSIER